MIMVMAGKIITERMEVLENEMTKQFDAKLKISMEEQYHNKEKIKDKSPGGNNSETKQ
jgi:hypothetical protein